MLSTELLETNKLLEKHTAVKDWLADRSQVLVHFCELTGNKNQANLPEVEQITGFCGALIDYVSAGHFEMYEQIVNNCQVNGPESINLLEELYPRIAKTTDVVVDFNEKYSKVSGDELQNLSEFDKDLSQLGEAIAKRVDLEDDLIETLSSKH